LGLWSWDSCRCSFRDFAQQPVGFLLQRENVAANLRQRTEWFGFVEVAGEADFVADLGGVLLHPSIRRVGQDFAADEGLDAAFFEKRNLLAVAQVGIRFVFDDTLFPIDGDFVKAVQRIGLGGGGFSAFA